MTKLKTDPDLKKIVEANKQQIKALKKLLKSIEAQKDIKIEDTKQTYNHERY